MNEPAPENSIRAAVFSASDEDRAFACSTVSHANCIPVDFAHFEDLVGALVGGEKFKIVIAGFEGDIKKIRSGIKILQRVSKGSAPILLMIRADQLNNLNDILEISSDFVFLPLKQEEFKVRLLASLWKDQQLSEKKNQLSFKGYQFNRPTRSVFFEGKSIRLKKREFELALFLFRNAGVVQSRETIRKELWSNTSPDWCSRTIDVHIAHIRRKLDVAKVDGEIRISGVFGIGYVLIFDCNSVSSHPVQERRNSHDTDALVRN